jgi:predicted phosphodiesterase
MARDWVQLAGNHERQLLQNAPEQRGASDVYAHAQLTSGAFEWMASLGHTRKLDENVVLCHGTPASDCVHLLATVEPGGLRVATREEVDGRLGGTEATLVACGHTHLPRCLRSSRGQLVVNPGSVGLQAYVDSTPYPYAVETGSPQARYAIAERQRDGWSVAPIALPYDTEAMARLARDRGFPLWEHALRTGCLP